jgi:hypothetical protein
MIVLDESTVGQAEIAEVDSIRVEVETGSTVLALARTEPELDDHTGALQAIGNTRKALEYAKRFLC